MTDGNDYERPSYRPPSQPSEPPHRRYPPPSPRPPAPTRPTNAPSPEGPSSQPHLPHQAPPPQGQPQYGQDQYPPPYEFQQPGPPPPPSSFEPLRQSPSGGRGGKKIALAAAAAAVAASIALFSIVAPTDDDSDEGVATDEVVDNAADSADSSEATGADSGTETTDSDAGSIDGNDGTASSVDNGGGETLSAGNDVECVLDAIDDSLLPDGVSTLDELYQLTVTSEANTAYLRADFACHPEPVGSDALTEALRANLELGSGSLIEVDTAETRCVTQYLVDYADDPYRVLAVGTDQADIDAMRVAMETCFDAEDVAYLNRESGSGPQNYGEEPRLDGLFDECTAGDERTCDLLWIGTSEGSEYSQLAFDCAGRGATASGMCTPDIDLAADGFAEVTSAGVSKLTEECRAGDPTSCDLLAAISPPGTKSEALGFTCGGLVSGTALPDCRTELGNG